MVFHFTIFIRKEYELEENLKKEESKLLLKKGEEEGNIQYMGRMLRAIMVNLNLRGLTIAVKTEQGNSIITSLGEAVYLQVIDEDTWNDYWGE